MTRLDELLHEQTRGIPIDDPVERAALDRIRQTLRAAGAPAHPPLARPRGPRRFTRMLAFAFPVLGAAALVLLLAGAFSGPANTGTQPAIAAVIRGIENATTLKPGTIEVSKYRVSYRNRSARTTRFTIETVYETPAGHEPQNSLYVNSRHLWGMAGEQAVSGGEEEVYLAKTNTIYISSIWGPYITNGKRPGTFIYTVPGATNGVKPLRLSAAQATALRDGTDQVLAVPTGQHVKLRIAPRRPFPTDAQSFRLMVKSNDIKIVGFTPVNGRRAIELAGPRFNQRHSQGGNAGVEAWVDPKTYAPIKEIVDRPPLFKQIQTWIEYKTLPITPSNERLLSLIARHPHARIDRNQADYRKAAHGDMVFTG